MLEEEGEEGGEAAESARQGGLREGIVYDRWMDGKVLYHINNLPLIPVLPVEITIIREAVFSKLIP